MNGAWLSASARVWWRRLRVMTTKEMIQLLRDPMLMFLIVYAFTADVYNAGSGVTLQLKQAAVAVMDQDRSEASRELLSRFQPPYFKIVGSVASEREGERLLDNAGAMLVISVAPQFEKSLVRGDQTQVQMQIDATNSVLGFLAYSDATQIVSAFGLQAAAKRMGLDATAGVTAGMPVVENEQRVWYNPNQNDAWFMSISEMLNVITLLALLLPAAAMVREKERGTIEQLLVSPLTPMQIMLPKVFSMTFVILLGTGLSFLLVLKPIFGVPFRGSVALFLLITTFYIVAISGLGLFIATIARNLAQVGMLAILLIAPMIFLSGAWTPPEAMPVVMRYAMYISPLYYYIDAAYGIVLKGAGLDILWPSVLGIVVLGSVTAALGLWRFRRQFD